MEKDLTIWEKIRNGDALAMKELHDKYYYQLYLYAQRISNHPSILDEAVSDCFIKLWTRRNELVIERSVKSYLFLMLRNGMIDMLRSKKHSLHFEDKAIPDLPGDDVLDELDRYASLYNAINKIPDQRRRILELAVFESFTYAQIAENLNISVNTVKTQMGRAYRFLKEELDPKSVQLFLMIRSRSCNLF